MPRLVWLRNDLRIHDNPALYHAGEAREGVVVLFTLCGEFIDRHSTAPARVDLVIRQLESLAADLAKLNIPLQAHYVARAIDIAPLLVEISQKHQCREVYFNAEYPLDERRRDEQVMAALKVQGVDSRVFHDRVLIPPGRIRNGQGAPYQVFTAFKRKWLELAMSVNFHTLPAPAPQPVPAVGEPAQPDAGGRIAQLASHCQRRDLSALWPAGEDEAYRRLTNFIEQDLDDYKWQRNFPALEGTSTLSPYLAIGAVSPRHCLNAARAANGGELSGGNEGASTWISELIWREFYQHLVVDFPQVCRFQPMQPRMDAFPWKQDPDLFERWCAGETGIPIVDAAMLQLKDTGWMHNRLRMITAMFLTKNLQMDWRLGERYFMSQLIDGDFAANNGGWQWSASTGADAVPYFRIFNPVTQSRRFDPEGAFIREHLPALRHLSSKEIHQPPPVQGYPRPLVDLAESRKSTLAIFSNLR